MYLSQFYDDCCFIGLFLTLEVDYGMLSRHVLCNMHLGSVSGGHSLDCIVTFIFTFYLELMTACQVFLTVWSYMSDQCGW
jgi:hypothetical protein